MMMRTPGSFSIRQSSIHPDDRALRQPAEERCSSRRVTRPRGFGIKTGTLMRDARSCARFAGNSAILIAKPYCLIAGNTVQSRLCSSVRQLRGLRRRRSTASAALRAVRRRSRCRSPSPWRFLEQPLGRLVDAAAPGDRGHAPHEIRPAGVGAGALAVERRAVETHGIARPPAAGAGRGHAQWREYFRGRDQPRRSSSASCSRHASIRGSGCWPRS